MESLSQYDLVIFDLDDTIYEEKNYLYNSYHAISNYVAEKYLCDDREVNSYLKQTFERDGRKDLFDKLCTKFKFQSNEINVFLSLMRNVYIYPKIEPYKYFIKLAKQLLKEKKNIAVITNGNVIQQKNKINSINWHGLKSKINFIFANEHAPKPDPSSFNFVKEQINFKMAVYIGDSLSDEEFAINCNIKFINVDYYKLEDEQGKG